jgi:hypothetical protein
MIAVGEKMIGEGEGPHRRANPLLDIVDLTQRRWPVKRLPSHRMHNDRIREWHREVNRVAADTREVPGWHGQAPVHGKEQRPVANSYVLMCLCSYVHDLVFLLIRYFSFFHYKAG